MFSRITCAQCWKSGSWDNGLLLIIESCPLVVQPCSYKTWAPAIFFGMSTRGLVRRFLLGHVPCECGAWLGIVGHATFIDERGLPLDTEFLFYSYLAGLTLTRAFHRWALYDVNKLRCLLGILWLIHYLTILILISQF